MFKAQLFITCLGDQFYTSTLQNMRVCSNASAWIRLFHQNKPAADAALCNGFEDQTRAEAGYETAIDAAKRHGIKMPMLRR